MFLWPQYGTIMGSLKSTSTMGGMAPYTLLEGQKLSKRVEFWMGKGFDNSRMFSQ